MPKMQFPMRLPAETVLAIDKVAGPGNRTAWIRDLIERELAGDVAQPAEQPSHKGQVAGSSPAVTTKSPPVDHSAVADALRERPMSERGLREHLGWMEGRVSRAVNELLGLGHIRPCNAGFEVVD